MWDLRNERLCLNDDVVSVFLSPFGLVDDTHVVAVIVDHLDGIHQKLLAAFEDDLEGLALDHGVAECSWLAAYSVRQWFCELLM